MTKKDTLQSIARKVTGDETLKCNTVRSALHCIAEEAKGEKTNCKTINEALTCIDENVENLIGGDRTAEAITITENGVTTTPTGKFYNPITVNVSGGGISGSKLYAFTNEDSTTSKTVYIDKPLSEIDVSEDWAYACYDNGLFGKTIASKTDSTITLNMGPSTGAVTFTRDSSEDKELGEISLDTNKTATITSNGTVEILPSSGKEGMEKATVTVNVSGGGSGASAYCWARAISGDEDIYYFYLNTSVSPNSVEELKNTLHLSMVSSGASDTLAVMKTFSDWNISEFVRVSDTEFTFTISGGPGGTLSNTFTRVTADDITLWEVSD